MRGVPGEENAADLVTVGDKRGGFPDPVAEVAQLDAVVTEATADELEATLLGQRLSRFGERVALDRQEPTGLVIDRDEH